MSESRTGRYIPMLFRCDECDKTNPSTKTAGVENLFICHDCMVKLGAIPSGDEWEVTETFAKNMMEKFQVEV